MKLSAFLLFTCSIICFGQSPHIKSGSTVYIEPMNGYETYLAAAIVKKHVPLIMVIDREKADYLIRSTVTQTTPSQPAVVVNNTNVNNGNSEQHGYPGRGGYLASLSFTNASIAVIDARSFRIIFGYSADRGGFKGTAETCAKHLKEFIEKNK